MVLAPLGKVGIKAPFGALTRRAGPLVSCDVTLRHLVKEALRMRPSRIVVGEVRAAECLDLLLALNSGLPGMAAVAMPA